jgi:hypothetical protein
MCSYVQKVLTPQEGGTREAFLDIADPLGFRRKFQELSIP